MRLTGATDPSQLCAQCQYFPLVGVGESSSEGEEESEDESQSEGMTEDERCGAQSCWLRKACASIGEVRGR